MGITLARTGTATVEFSQPQEVVISHLDDSIKIGDGVDLLAVNTDGSINTRLSDGVDALAINTDGSLNTKISDGVDSLAINTDGSLNTRLSDGVDLLAINTDGSITARLSDGTDALVINTDGSINTNTTLVGGSISGNVSTVETGTVETAYAEVLSVAAATLTTVVSYTATQATRLKIAEVSGTNIAEYTININGTPIHKKRTFFGNLDNNFQFSKGYALVTSDIVTVKVLHNQGSPGDFNAFILVLKD